MPVSCHAVEILQIGTYPNWDQVPLDAASFVNGHTLYVDGGITASL